jgi:hypothetical protein
MAHERILSFHLSQMYFIGTLHSIWLMFKLCLLFLLFHLNYYFFKSSVFQVHFVIQSKKSRFMLLVIVKDPAS